MRLFACDRGVTLAEYAIVIALVALGALAAWSTLGDAVTTDVDCAADAIASVGGAPCRVEAGPPNTAPSRAALANANANADADADASANALTTGAPSAEARRIVRALELVRDRHTSLGLDARAPTSLRSLEAALRDSSGDPALRDAADALFGSESLRNALDVGAGRHDVDGRVSRDDVVGLLAALGSSPTDARLRALLADTAAGRGGRDGDASRSDYEALSNDSRAPAAIRAWARERFESMPAHRGCGFMGTGCAWSAVSGAAKSAWTHTSAVRDATRWSMSLAERIAWTIGPPPLDPREWGDWARFRFAELRGMGDWVAGAAKGLYALGGWVVHPDVSDLTFGNVARVVASIPIAIWDKLDTFATADDPSEAGRAGGSLMLDVASTIVPVGVPAKLGRAGSIAADARVAARATDFALGPPPRARPPLPSAHLEARPGLPRGLCFAAGTEVRLGDGELAPIESLSVGSRVRTLSTDAGGGTEVDATWMRVVLAMKGGVEVELLRSPRWIEALGVRKGRSLHLVLEEMRVEGDARVLAVEPAPTIAAGEGRVVLATVRSTSADVVSLRFEASAQTIRATTRHPLYSIDRDAWIPAGSLRPGERLRAARGPVTIASIDRVPGAQRVYNLEVETDHTFLVSRLGVLSHNNHPCAAGGGDATGDALTAMAASGQTEAVEAILTRQVSAAMAAEADALGIEIGGDAMKSVVQRSSAFDWGNASVSVDATRAGLPFRFSVTLSKGSGETTVLTLNRIHGDAAAQEASWSTITRLAREWRVGEITARVDQHTTQSAEWWTSHGFEEVGRYEGGTLYRRSLAAMVADTGLGREVDALIARDADLAQRVASYRAAGSTIEWAAPGRASEVADTGAAIRIDSSLRGTPEAAGELAELLGRAQSSRARLARPQGLTLSEYTELNAARVLDPYAEGVLRRLEARKRILDAGGADIGGPDGALARIHGAFGATDRARAEMRGYLDFDLRSQTRRRFTERWRARYGDWLGAAPSSARPRLVRGPVGAGRFPEESLARADEIVERARVASHGRGARLVVDGGRAGVARSAFVEQSYPALGVRDVALNRFESAKPDVVGTIDKPPLLPGRFREVVFGDAETAVFTRETDLRRAMRNSFQLIEERGGALRMIADIKPGIPAETVARAMRDAGFEDVRFRPQTGDEVAASWRRRGEPAARVEWARRFYGDEYPESAPVLFTATKGARPTVGEASAVKVNRADAAISRASVYGAPRLVWRHDAATQTRLAPRDVPYGGPPAAAPFRRGSFGDALWERAPSARTGAFAAGGAGREELRTIAATMRPNGKLTLVVEGDGSVAGIAEAMRESGFRAARPERMTWGGFADALRRQGASERTVQVRVEEARRHPSLRPWVVVGKR